MIECVETASAAPRVRILVLEAGRGLPLPEYMTPGAAGADCYAAVTEQVRLAPMERRLIPLGFSLALPIGFEAQLRPRSGLALKSGITLLNSPGTVDADYRGPVGAILINLGSEEFVISRGDRVAQMVIAPVAQARFDEAESLDETQRLGGFGSTGIELSR
jgi:dUTP pyrophosphatase